MFTRLIVSTIVAAVVLAASPVSADWNVGDPYKMHFPQLPDLSPNGMDVLAGLTENLQIKYLADDFLCTQTGPITDVHIWGSWLNDQFQPVPNQGTFVLGIYDDIPADPIGLTHSRPGNLLWEKQFLPGEYIAREYAIAPEQFFDPNLNQIIGQDSVVWQYNFLIDEALAFVQDKDNIYWLAVANVDPNGDGIINSSDLADVMAGTNRFGWKTSVDHFNDDAVFIDFDAPLGQPTSAVGLPQGAPAPGLPWRELIDPFTGQSLDLSFVITPEPGSLALLALGAVAMLRRR